MNWLFGKLAVENGWLSFRLVVLIIILPALLVLFGVFSSGPSDEEVRYFDGAESCWVANRDSISKYQPCTQADLKSDVFGESIEQAKISGYQLAEIADLVEDIAVSRTARLSRETEDSGYAQHIRKNTINLIVGPSTEKDELESLLEKALN
jgi:hypothetical protein